MSGDQNRASQSVEIPPEAVDKLRKTCGMCWFNETPRLSVVTCPCCRNGHYDGHFDLDGNPQ